MMRRRIKSVPIKQQYTESFRKASDFLRLVLPVNSDLSYVNPFSAFFPINHCFLKLFRPVFQFSIRNTGHYPNLMMGIRAVLILPLAKKHTISFPATLFSYNFLYSSSLTGSHHSLQVFSPGTSTAI